MSTKMDFKNWPKWIKDLLPDDLYNAYGDVQKHDVKASGRKSSIDKDNVNDLSYYYYSKKKEYIKSNKKGTDKSPIEYAFGKSSVKCFCFLYKDSYKYGSEVEMLKRSINYN